MKRINLKILVLLTLTLGCNNRKLAPAEYENFLISEDSGLTFIFKGLNDIKIMLTYEPREWLAFKYSVSQNGIFDENEYNSHLNENQGRHQFSMKLYTGGKSIEQFFEENYENSGDALLYLEHELKNDFTLSVGDKQNAPKAIGVHYQNSFKVKPYEELVILFNSETDEDQHSPLALTYKDPLFGLNEITVEISEKTLKNYPRIKF